MKHNRLLHCLAGLALFAVTATTHAITIDFETLPDLTSVGDFYGGQGVHFLNAISLTGGFSLNEFDYPPHSGDIVIGDDNAPLVIVFDTATEAISGYFTYGVQITFSAYDENNNLIGNFINPTASNLGASELIALPFMDVRSLVIAGTVNNMFTLDDFSFTPSAPSSVPDGGMTLTMMLAALGSLFGLQRLRASKTGSAERLA